MLRPAALFAIAAVAGLASGAAQAQPSLEYAVKAAYLVKFAPFIEWPENAFAGPAAPLTICVLGNDALGANLDKAAEGQKDGEHPITVRRLSALDPAAPCNILFTSDAAAAESAVESLKTRPVVTVVDSSVRTRAAINFVVIDNHVRFDIDAAWAEGVGIHFSSKLLGLAHAVQQKGARP